MTTIRKGDMVMNIAPLDLIKCQSEMLKYVPHLFFGVAPKRARMWNGRKHYVPKEFVMGYVESDKLNDKLLEKTVRVVRFRPDRYGKAKLKQIHSAIHRMADAMGVELEGASDGE